MHIGLFPHKTANLELYVPDPNAGGAPYWGDDLQGAAQYTPIRLTPSLTRLHLPVKIYPPTSPPPKSDATRCNSVYNTKFSNTSSSTHS